MLIYCGNNPIILPDPGSNDNKDFDWKAFIIAVAITIMICIFILNIW